MEQIDEAETWRLVWMEMRMRKEYYPGCHIEREIEKRRMKIP